MQSTFVTTQHAQRISDHTNSGRLDPIPGKQTMQQAKQSAAGMLVKPSSDAIAVASHQATHTEGTSLSMLY
jgi:hypothetical protein